MKTPKLHNLVSLSLALRWVGLGLATVLTLVAGYLWWQQVQMEAVYYYTCALPAGERVTLDCLERVPAPVNRQFTAVTDSAAIVDRWTTHAVLPGELVHPAHLTTQPPEHFRFASGRALPTGQYGYWLPVPAPVLNVTTAGDLLTLSLADAEARQLHILLDKAPVLHTEAGGIFLGLTLPQIGALEGLLAAARAAEAPAQVFVWLLTQPANPAVPPRTTVTLTLTGLEVTP